MEIYRVDENHGNSMALFNKMGRPENLSAIQIEELRKAGELSPVQRATIRNGRTTVNVPPYGLAVLVIGAGNPKSAELMK